MITPCFLVGFTGHRCIADPALVSKSLHQVWNDLQGAVTDGTVEVFSGIAYGSDIIAVETARAANLRVHLMLPKTLPHVGDTKSGFAADFWEIEADGTRRFRTDDWARAEKQISDALLGHGGGTLRVGGGARNEPDCYYDSGIAMVEACDALIAVWDGRPSDGLGGTADLVEYATRIGLPLVIVDPHSGKMTKERFELFARKSDPGREIIEQVRQACGAASTTRPATVEALFQCFEHYSQQDSTQFRHSLVGIIKFHGIATFIAAVACILPHGTAGWMGILFLLSLLEFCIIVYAVRKSLYLNKNHVHERWVKIRFATELIRALRYSAGLLDPLFPLVARHDKSWKRFVMTIGLMLHRETFSTILRKSWMDARKSYVDNRLEHIDPEIGQITFFNSKQSSAESHFRKTVGWGGILSKSTVLFIFGAVLYKGQRLTAEILYGPSHESAVASQSWTFTAALTAIVFSLLPVVLPLAAGVFISLRSALDSGRRTYRYKELELFLIEGANELKSLKTETAVRQKVAAIEEVLLDELIEWRLAEQQNGAH